MGCAFNKFNISTNQQINKSTNQQINISTFQQTGFLRCARKDDKENAMSKNICIYILYYIYIIIYI